MGVLVGCGRAIVHTSPSTSLVVERDPSTPHLSLIDKLSSNCIINESCQKLLTPKIAPSFWLGFTVDSMAIDSFLNSLLSLLAAKF
jgi:hypothetical protein